MPELISPFELSNFIENKGFDVFPVRQPNGMYKCIVWQLEKSLGLGRFEYKSWKDAVYQTQLKIYDKYN